MKIKTHHPLTQARKHSGIWYEGSDEYDDLGHFKADIKTKGDGKKRDREAAHRWAPKVVLVGEGAPLLNLAWSSRTTLFAAGRYSLYTCCSCQRHFPYVSLLFRFLTTGCYFFFFFSIIRRALMVRTNRLLNKICRRRGVARQIG